jgi:glycine oxidase
MPDVVVVGGGIIGCAVAEALSARGAAVRVIDPRPLAGGATQASGGMLVPHAEGMHHPSLEALGARSLGLYDSFVAKHQPDIPVPYERTGSLHVAFDDEEAAELEVLERRHRERGIQTHLLTGPEARSIEPGLAADCVRALLVPVPGYVSAPDLARGLFAAAASRGASWMTAGVQRIARDHGTGLRVETSTGTLTSTHVVLAAGTWTPQLEIEGVPPLPIRPVRGQLLHLRWASRAASRIVWGARSYLVPWPDGTMLVGATTEDVGFDERATVTGVRDLLDAAAEILPAAWQAEFGGVRVGLRPASPDELPIVGPSTRLPGLVYATAHYRNGVLLAPLTADLVVHAIEGGDDPAFATLSPSRFGDY